MTKEYVIEELRRARAALKSRVIATMTAQMTEHKSLSKASKIRELSTSDMLRIEAYPPRGTRESATRMGSSSPFWIVTIRGRSPSSRNK